MTTLLTTAAARWAMLSARAREDVLKHCREMASDFADAASEDADNFYAHGRQSKSDAADAEAWLVVGTLLRAAQAKPKRRGRR